jgi:hypothetical protein
MLRLLAAAQHSSSELGSALALHINCIVIQRTGLLREKDCFISVKKPFYFGEVKNKAQSNGTAKGHGGDEAKSLDCSS